MLKRRLIPVIFLKNGSIVRSENFNSYRIIGNPLNEVERYNQWDVDELIYINISDSDSFPKGRLDHNVRPVSSIIDTLDLVSDHCFMPLCFGGGIRDLEAIANYILRGADKVIVNTLLYENPGILKSAVDIFGSQALVCCVDYTFNSGTYSFFSNSGSVQHAISDRELIDRLIDIDCGEVMLHDIARDGVAEGFDLKGIEYLAKQLPMPVIACGGAGNDYDFEEIARLESVSAIAAGNYFHFSENSYSRVKMMLKKLGYKFR
jgi:cyclase